MEEIKKESGKKDIKTKCIIADFSKMTKISEYEAIIQKDLKDMDISMLILNAGWIQMGPFLDLTPEEIETTVNVDVLQPVYISKTLLP